MTRNIYDRVEFFAGYSELSRSVRGLDGASEWPAVRALLPDLTGKRVIDLGCGFGWFSRFAVGQGAASVLALDISEKMIARARTDTSEAAITYEIADLEHLQLAGASFDFAYSSLALHYVDDFAGVVATVHDALIPGSRFVFTIEHPIFMAPSNPDWSTDVEGRRVWPLDRYAVEGPRTTDWLAKDVVKQHRKLGTTLNTLIAAGFAIRHVEEWSPNDRELQDNPDWVQELDRPMFLLISVQR
ncbi:MULTISPECIES: class I SAM-dependent methyltransferase [unclassified Rhizobium]|uniref:class I SAM-dependent methyltransferase n=1 Tax=unclassified Rhizobium TaxID=2613769 RepID=UPI001A99348F|nr:MULTISPECIES: class I SAM-dependent methyltransferase [unclassified Rhizobium]MBX5170206.1 class I SAM-dependent methyltransferase [Rhizobium sp. NZLR1b]MBX5203984.1 class I SAM-dependent methyltransferase [Rhizobium sp. NZLR1]QSZ19802.1 class I SAM-dependent methyltransferase [Rhizobium sp. NZLR1]